MNTIEILLTKSKAINYIVLFFIAIALLKYMTEKYKEVQDYTCKSKTIKK